jgi:hypothetical protein
MKLVMTEPSCVHSVQKRQRDVRLYAGGAGMDQTQHLLAIRQTTDTGEFLNEIINPNE